MYNDYEYYIEKKYDYSSLDNYYKEFEEIEKVKEYIDKKDIEKLKEYIEYKKEFEKNKSNKKTDNKKKRIKKQKSIKNIPLLPQKNKRKFFFEDD